MALVPTSHQRNTAPVLLTLQQLRHIRTHTQAESPSFQVFISATPHQCCLRCSSYDTSESTYRLNRPRSKFSLAQRQATGAYIAAACILALVQVLNSETPRQWCLHCSRLTNQTSLRYFDSEHRELRLRHTPRFFFGNRMSWETHVLHKTQLGSRHTPRWPTNRTD